MDKSTAFGVEVLERVGGSYKVRCIPCGNVFEIFASRLSETRSCGCAHKRALAAAKTVHDESSYGRRTTEYVTWINMWRRCRNPTGRDRWHKGVRVCARWRSTRTSWSTWAVGRHRDTR